MIAVEYVGCHLMLVVLIVNYQEMTVPQVSISNRTELVCMHDKKKLSPFPQWITLKGICSLEGNSFSQSITHFGKDCKYHMQWGLPGCSDLTQCLFVLLEAFLDVSEHLFIRALKRRCAAWCQHLQSVKLHIKLKTSFTFIFHGYWIQDRNFVFENKSNV